MGEFVFDHVSVQGRPLDPAFTVRGDFYVGTIFLKIKKFFRVDPGNSSGVMLVDHPLDGACGALPRVKPAFEGYD